MAVTTTTTQIANNAWAELGAGPLALQALEGEVFVQIADDTPGAAVNGFVLRPNMGKVDFDTTSNLWAMSAALSGKATVVSAPVTA